MKTSIIQTYQIDLSQEEIYNLCNDITRIKDSISGIKLDILHEFQSELKKLIEGRSY